MSEIHGPPAPNVTFTLALATVAARASELAIAIAGGEDHRAQRLAIRAVDAWLVGRTTCAQILGRVQPGYPYAESARVLLEQHYLRLLMAFRRAATVTVPTQALLAVERRRLTDAMAQPLDAWLVRAVDEAPSLPTQK